MMRLLETFSSAAPAERVPRAVMEWNPFSQRLYMNGAFTVKTPALVAHFAHATEVIEDFIILCHEALHVLLWEPFFVGAMRYPNGKRFRDLSMCFEGLCFWYSDIVLSRTLRVKLPDGEFLHARDAVSLKRFHPYRAFTALGITDPEKIRDIYLHAFMGDQTKLYARRDQAFVRELCGRIMHFYFESAPPIASFHTELRRMGIATRFRERFCTRPGLPAVLPEEVLGMSVDEDPVGFCAAVMGDGLAHLAGMPSREVHRVRARRAIQTRAYLAYSMLAAVSGDRLMTRRGGAVDGAPLKDALERYLDRLEAALAPVCERRPRPVLDKTIRATDGFYAERVQAYLARHDVWLSARGWYHPPLATRTKTIGILRAASTASPADLRRMSAALLNACVGKDLVGALTLEDKRAAGMTAAVVGLATETLRESTARGGVSRRWRTAWNRLLLDPKMLSEWSIELATIDPSKERYREVLFRYE